MGAYATKALDVNDFNEIINLLISGFETEDKKMSPKLEVAFALTLQANLGLRISDIVNLKLTDIITDAGRYRIDIIEKKTKKERAFTVPVEIYEYMMDYCLENGIRKNNKMIKSSARSIQRNLKQVIDYLGYKKISTHSFRKFFATSIYVDSGYNLLLVQTLLQHSNPKTTEKYISISSKEIEDALNNHKILPKRIIQK